MVLLLLLLLSALQELSAQVVTLESEQGECFDEMIAAKPCRVGGYRVPCRGMFVTNDLRQHYNTLVRLVHHPEHVSELKPYWDYNF